MDRENRERADLSPYEQGAAYRRALDEGLYPSARRLAEALGVSHTWVNNTLEVADLPPAVVRSFPSPLAIQHRHARSRKLGQSPGATTYGSSWSLKLTRFRGRLILTGKRSDMPQRSLRIRRISASKMVELVHAGRRPAQLAREFGVTAQSISSWAAQAAGSSRRSARLRGADLELATQRLKKLRRAE